METRKPYPLRNAERGGGDVRDAEVVEDVGVSSGTENREQSNAGQRKQSKQRKPRQSRHGGLQLQSPRNQSRIFWDSASFFYISEVMRGEEVSFFFFSSSHSV